jgi:hypothetical protein
MGRATLLCEATSLTMSFIMNEDHRVRAVSRTFDLVRTKNCTRATSM